MVLIETPRGAVFAAEIAAIGGTVAMMWAPTMCLDSLNVIRPGSATSSSWSDEPFASPINQPPSSQRSPT